MMALNGSLENHNNFAKEEETDDTHADYTQGVNWVHQRIETLPHYTPDLWTDEDYRNIWSFFGDDVIRKLFVHLDESTLLTSSGAAKYTLLIQVRGLHL